MLWQGSVTSITHRGCNRPPPARAGLTGAGGAEPGAAPAANTSERITLRLPGSPGLSECSQLRILQGGGKAWHLGEEGQLSSALCHPPRALLGLGMEQTLLLVTLTHSPPRTTLKSSPLGYFYFFEPYSFLTPSL